MWAEAFGMVAGGYVLLIGSMAAFQREMIYHPSSETAEPAEVGLPQMTRVPVKAADGLTISGWYAPPERRSHPTVVLFHGNGGSIVRRAGKAGRLLEAGFGVFLLEYRGYGGNPGRPSEQGFYDDARGVLQWLASGGVPPGRIVLYGESLGSGVAVQMAIEYEVAAVVLEAPFTRLAELVPPFLVPGLADMLLVDRYDTLSKIDRVTAPLLVLHGEHDGIVPIHMGRRVLAAAVVEKEGVFLPQGDHNDLWQHGAGDAVVSFLERLLR